MEAVEAQVSLVAEKVKSSCPKIVSVNELNQKLENRLLDNQQLEDQLEDEDDAQSEGSIRLRYSDDEAEDDDKTSGTSESVNNNQEEKIVNDDQVKESTVFPSTENVHHHLPIMKNGINILKNDKIDFTKDDPLMGIDFCDNDETLVKNNDDNLDKNIGDNLNNITDDNFNDNIDENGLIPVKEIIDKTITFNQYPQSAYDSSWRLGLKPRKRCRNNSEFLRITNFKRFHSDYKKSLDNSNEKLSDKSSACIVEKISDKDDVDEKLTNPTVENECLRQVFPPPSLKFSADKEPIKQQIQVVNEDNDDNKPENAEVELTSEKINLENDEMVVENVENKTEESLEKEACKVLDKNPDSFPVESQENETLVNGHVDEDPEKSDLTKSDDTHHEKQDDTVTNGTDESIVLKDIEEVNENKISKESVENDSTEPMADESSDSGIVSTPASVTTIDELLKDETEDIIKEKTNDESPKLSSEVTLEPIITKKSLIPAEGIEVDEKETEETIETEKNKTVELMEIDDEEKINETTEQPVEKQETIVTNEELNDTKGEKSIKEESTKPETSDVDNEKSLPAGLTEIVNLDDCPEVTIEPVTKKSDKLKDLVIDEPTKLVDPPKSETFINNSESVDIENFDISILNDNQEDSKNMTTKTDKKKRRAARSSLGLEKENVCLRVKRETAQKAEELIRKDCQDDTEDESDNDDSDILRRSINTKTQSPPSLKRNSEELFDKMNIKRAKRDIIPNGKIETKVETINPPPTRLDNIRKIFMRDSKQKLGNIRQEDLEELLIQKIVETITMRDEIGKLREQAKLSERAKELAQHKCTALAKQLKEFELVMNRYGSDREKNPGHYVAPIKINRSVGLQVNMLGDRGVQNIRQIAKNQQQQQQQQPILPKTSPVNRLSQGSITPSVSVVTSVITSVTQSPSDDTSQNRSKGLRIRSPRKPEANPTTSVITHISNPLNQTRIINSIPSPVVMSKIGDSRGSIGAPGITTTPVLTNTSIVVNGNIANQQQYRQTRVTAGQNRNNSENLIDLTEEDEKNKIMPCPPGLTALVTPTSAANIQKTQQRPPRIITNNSANVTLTPSGIRLMTGQPTPSGIMNNMNGQRLMFFQQGSSPRQLIFTSTANSQRTVATTNARNSYTNITHAGLPTITTKGTPVRVMPASGGTVQLMKHPAPLPPPPAYSATQGFKMPPPAPSLKISKVTHGIVLSWNMSLTDKYADIASYQLYAYQEISTTPPNSNLWKKVGDVRALPLPMACTLTQFLEGNNYFFAVRAVDTHGRLGEFSQPGNITL